MKRVVAMKDSVLKIEVYMFRSGFGFAKKLVGLVASLDDCLKNLSQVLSPLIVFEDFGSIL
jgi:hypothetical protein